MKKYLLLLSHLISASLAAQNIHNFSVLQSPYTGVSHIPIPTPGQIIVDFADSYGVPTGASVTERGFAQIIAARYRCTLTNLGVAGSTIMKRTPVDYEGTSNFIDRLGTIPAYTNAYGLLIIEGGLNDLGQTAAAYTSINYRIDYDSILHYITSNKSWPPSKILIIGPGWIGFAGYAQYAIISGNTAPTVARHLEFIAATKDESIKWGTNYIDLYQDQLHHDTTLISASDHIHPTDAGYAFIANQILQYIGTNLKLPEIQTLVDASTVTWDLNYGRNAILTLGGNRTLNVTNMVAGDQVTLEVTQDATGSRTLTPPTGSYTTTGLFVPSATASSKTSVYGTYDGTQWIWSLNNLTAVPNDPTNAFVAQLTSLGFTPGGTEITAYHTFHDAAVTHGYWTKIVLFYPFSGITAATQSLNFMNPLTTAGAFYITWNGTITTRDINGFKGNGTTGYGDTHFNPFLQLSSLNSAYTAWWTDGTVTTNQGMGCFDNFSHYFGINYNYDGTHTATAIEANNSLININNPTVNQCFTVSRTSATAMSMYANGSSIGSDATSVTVGLPNWNVLLGAINNIGTPSIFTAQRYCFYIASTGMTSTDVSNLYSDLTALKTGMGR